MRILAIADIHGHQYRLNIVLKNIEMYSPDVVVVCGDITQFGPAEVARNLLDQIPVETFAVPGNCDPPEVSKMIDKSKAINIDMKRVERHGIPFVGISRVTTYSILDKPVFIDGNEKKSVGNVLDEKCILVSHEPPYGVQDRVFMGIHGGSRELKEIVEKYKPRLVLCGHIHEDPGVTKFKETFVVNCSMGKYTEGALIDLNDEINIRIID